MSITIGEYVLLPKESPNTDSDIINRCRRRVALVIAIPCTLNGNNTEVAGVRFNDFAHANTDSWYWPMNELEYLPGFRVQSWDAGQQAIFLSPKGEWLRCRLKWAGCVSDQSADVMLLNTDGSDLVARTISVADLRVYPAEKDKPRKSRRTKREPDTTEYELLPWSRRSF